MKRWFLPHTPDLLGLLHTQAEVTLRGLDAFVAWSGGDVDSEHVVRAAEHEADDARRALLTELRAAFSTPIDAEDIYELSERLDAIMNGAKNAVRESEVMRMAPDAPLAKMAAQVRDGVRHLDAAFLLLVSDPDRATAEADAATHCERKLERIYRVAASELLGSADVAEVMGRRELYRRYVRIGETVVEVAERVWYAVVKKA